MRVKKLFFEAKGVLDAAKKTEKAVLTRFGAFVWQRARTSLSVQRGVETRRSKVRGVAPTAKRRGKRSSRPGEPPTSHTKLLKRFLRFAYQPDRGSVVIGPELIRRPVKGVPRILEEGGSVRSRGRTVKIAPRPYMRPAFEAEKPGLPAMWRDSIRR
ncbi:MAG: hypothetical protein DDT37_01642 [Firmicutes bacterium]|nr:hypothetical protein [candidate division NPL-UPA2 bacterium]